VPSLRLLSWNVRDLLGDPLAVTRVLASARTDLACLQEVPRRLRSGPRLAAVARSAGLFVVAGGRSAGGVALLCSARIQVLVAQARLLPVEGRFGRPRGVVTASVRLIGAAPFALAVVHLPLEPGRRVQHATAVRDLLAQTALPTLVAGDLNEPPGGPAWRAFEPLLTPGRTPARPTRPGCRSAGSMPCWPARASGCRQTLGSRTRRTYAWPATTCRCPPCSSCRADARRGYRTRPDARAVPVVTVGISSVAG
jgi:hypothetical protein